MLVTLIGSKKYYLILHFREMLYSNIGYTIKHIIQIKLFKHNK